ERITRNEEKLKNFRTETYRLALQRLEKVIRDIKDYTYKVSKVNNAFYRAKDKTEETKKVEKALEKTEKAIERLEMPNHGL
ncbi:22257_t:CDS:2, partial [Gigaspora rosea]